MIVNATTTEKTFAPIVVTLTLESEQEKELFRRSMQHYQKRHALPDDRSFFGNILDALRAA